MRTSYSEFIQRHLTRGIVLLCLCYLYAQIRTLSATAALPLLGPTAAFVGAITNISFRFDPGLGFVADSDGFIITPACAGIRFFVIALSLCLLGSWPHRLNVKNLCGFIVITFTTTIIANSARILSLCMIEKAGSNLHLRPSWIHEGCGVFIYISMLFLLSLFIRALYDRTNHHDA